MKVKLENHRPKWTNSEGRYRAGVITWSPPFIYSRAGRMVHRPRKGTMHIFGDKTHYSFTCWCGMSLQKERAALVDLPPDGMPICATCEGRAIGAGQLGSERLINGRTVLYSARDKK